MAGDTDPRAERRRLMLVFGLAIGIPGVVLSWGSLEALRSDQYVLGKLREERLAGAIREAVELIESGVRESARAALSPFGEREAELAAGGPDGLARLAARLEAARGRNAIVREYLVLDAGGRLLLPLGGEAGDGDARAASSVEHPDDGVAPQDDAAHAGAEVEAPTGTLPTATALRGDIGLREAIARYERRQALERRLAEARRLELSQHAPAAARPIYTEVAADPGAPDLARRASLDLARCETTLGDLDGALAELDRAAAAPSGLRTEGGLPLEVVARLRGGELRIAAGRVDEGAARLIELAGDILSGRLDLDEGEGGYFVAKARAALEGALPKLDAPAYRTALERLERDEARRAETRAYARELNRRLLPDLRAALEGAGEGPETELATLGGETQRLVALRRLGPPDDRSRSIVLGVEVDPRRLLSDVVTPALARTARERRVALGVFDRRGRPVAETGEPSTDLRGERATSGSFEAILPLWRVRAAPAPGDEASSLARSRMLLQGGMVGVLLIAMGAGALFTLRAIDRSYALARMKSEFVSAISHELRTPLTSIRMFAELLRTGRAKTEEKRREYLELIESEGTRLQKLIDDILDFARHDAGRKEYRFEEGCAGETAEEAVASLGAQLLEAGFRIDLDVRRPLPPVLLDRESMRTAVENLISNSRKYSGERREVAVSVREESGFVAIEVRDRGVGIDPEELPRIFEKFFRGKDAEELNVPGSGLGLALVKRIVEDHGGRIAVESAKGEGTAFKILLRPVRR